MKMFETKTKTKTSRRDKNGTGRPKRVCGAQPDYHVAAADACLLTERSPVELTGSPSKIERSALLPACQPARPAGGPDWTQTDGAMPLTTLACKRRQFNYSVVKWTDATAGRRALRMRNSPSIRSLPPPPKLCRHVDSWRPLADVRDMYTARIWQCDNYNLK